MPRTLRQYYRMLLVKLGLFDKRAFMLGIDEIRADDLFICSFPKSGNTWVRFILAFSANRNAEINFRNIDSFVPDIYSATDSVNKARSPRLIKVHWPWFDFYPRTVYIVRDYRDVTLSYYHYQIALGEFKGSFSEYIKTGIDTTVFGLWSEHVLAAYKFKEQYPERIMILRYEDLINDTTSNISKLISFTSATKDVDVNWVEEQCSFLNLQDSERISGSAFNDKTGRPFFREGKSGGWRDVISAADHSDLLKKPNVLSAMKKAGYDIQ
ncbi:MAG: hypothetical protein RL007_771 [Bacteroidota bacterium]|jgi:estrone sulfotransferase